MSEYQYYEFQSIDRKLSEDELVQIRKLSSRVRPTPHCAIFTYSYSDFPRDHEKIIAKYFDIMLYAANWGTKKLCFRLPANLIDRKSILRYCHRDIISLSKHGAYYVLSIRMDDEEGGGWIDVEGVLDGLLSLRDDILNGDYRTLYLIWLKALDAGILDNNTVAPQIPISLSKLSLPLKRFIHFFEINEKSVKTAIAKNKSAKQPIMIKPEKYLKKLSEKDKMSFLLGILNGESHLQLKLRKKLERFNQKTKDIV